MFSALSFDDYFFSREHKIVDNHLLLKYFSHNWTPFLYCFCIPLELWVREDDCRCQERAGS